MRPRQMHRRPATTTRPRLEALEDRWLPDANFTYFPMGSGIWPYVVSPAQDGFWTFSHFGSGQNVISHWRFDGTQDEFTLPTYHFWGSHGGMAIGSDGNPWFAETTYNPDDPSGSTNYISVIDGSGTLREYEAPSAPGFDEISGVVEGPDGNIWFSVNRFNDPSYIGKITPDGRITTYDLSFPDDPGISASALSPAADGNIWFVVNHHPDPPVHDWGRITPDGVITLFRTPYAFLSDRQGIRWGGGFSELYGVDLAGDLVAQVSLPQIPDWFYGMSVLGPDATLWSVHNHDASVSAMSEFVQITPQGDVTRFPLPLPYQDYPAQFLISLQLWDMTVGADGNLWADFNAYDSEQSALVRMTWPQAGPVSQFLVSVYPTGPAVGDPVAVTVRALDAGGLQAFTYRGTVHFSSSDALAGLPADYTFTASDLGVHTFIGVTFGTVGDQTLTVSAGAATGSTTVHVLPAPAARFQLVLPAFATAGTPFDLTVQALDRFGNPTAGYTGTVHFGSTDPRANLPADYTFTAADQGVHTFTNVTLVTAGNPTVLASDGAAGLADQGTIDVGPAAMSGLAISAPGQMTAHLPFALTVYASDPYGNAIRTYQGTVHFTSSDALAGLPGDYSFSASDGGVHTFAGVVLHAVGTQTLSVSDGTFAGGATVTVSPLVGRFELDAPASVTAGVPFTVTLRVLDADSNLVPTYLGRVRWTSTDPQGDPPPDYDFTADDQGVHTFTATLRTAGLVHLAAGDDGGLEGGFDISVSPGAAAALDVQLPSELTVGVATTFIVRAVDLYGNAAGYTGTVHFASTDPRAILPADYTFTVADGGLHTFVNGLILRTTGAQSLGVSNSGGSLAAAQGSITVGPRTAPAVIAVAGGLGDIPEVRLIDPKTGQVLLDFLAYDPRFRGGVRVAVGDINADGVPDIVTVPGITGGADLKVWDGKTGHLIREFAAFPMAFTGGAFVAVADVNNDGYADIVAGKGPGSGPRVKVFSGKDGSLLANFLAYDASFAGGVRVAAGDVDADGFADVITGAGPGGGPHVEVWSGKDGSLLQSFIAFSPSFTGGVYVSAGDMDGDGHSDIIAGSGAGGPPEVKVLSGLDRHLLADFLAYGSAFTSGVRVGAFDLDGDGKAELLTAPGQGPTHAVKVFAADQTLLDKFFAFDPSDQSGVMLGGG